MTELMLTLLGGFEAFINEMPILAFESDKVRALLVYLILEAGHAHRREKLCGLFWPDKSERLARRSLSQSLYNLRNIINNDLAKPSFLLINQYDVQFNRASPHRLDTTVLDEIFSSTIERSNGNIDADSLQRLKYAVQLYSGDFLKGFSLRDSSPFEEWLLLRRERYNRIYIEALRKLVEYYRSQNECEQAIHYANLWIANDPYQEDAHYLLIQMLAYLGRRSAAIAHFEYSSALLRDELGAQPTPKLTALMVQIRAGGMIVDSQARLPITVYSAGGYSVDVAKYMPRSHLFESMGSPPLLAREAELTDLHTRLNRAMSGQGQVVLISGEAGRGKSALVAEFCQQAQQAHEQLIIAGGTCHAYAGVGDPCGAFRDILAALTSDSDATHASRLIIPSQLSRLWQIFPSVVHAILEVGPDLLDSFVPAMPLFKRLEGLSGSEMWVRHFQQLLQRNSGNKSAGTTLHRHLFAQYVAVLERLASQHPLLLVIDDLHRADLDTIALLFHLSTDLKDLPILIIGCYRPSELLLGHTHGMENGKHVLPPVLDELRRLYGNIEIRLSRDSDPAFVNHYLDQYPNQFDQAFRKWLDRSTAGNPLFTIEIVKSMQQDGSMTMDNSGKWKASAIPEWKELPPRLEAVISERIGRLPFKLRHLLTVASVEGDTFTAGVLAEILSISESEVIQLLSGELTYPHRLIRAEGVIFTGLQRACLYRFRQSIFRHYLYNQLDDVERPLFHEAVGKALERIYGVKEEFLLPISAQLAHHFHMTGLSDKAKYYWQMCKKTAALSLINGILLSQIIQ